ncbi:hypothetical protein RJT34_17807 [Clitoria ternatea]|uniref:Uncharacterized protein n=1 Tax=Clitoria ternatea TaxID=43366 RepID=A0AAN9JA00_CLITE
MFVFVGLLTDRTMFSSVAGLYPFRTLSYLRMDDYPREEKMMAHVISVMPATDDTEKKDIGLAKKLISTFGAACK